MDDFILDLKDDGGMEHGEANADFSRIPTVVWQILFSVLFASFMACRLQKMAFRREIKNLTFKIIVAFDLFH